MIAVIFVIAIFATFVGFAVGYSKGQTDSQKGAKNVRESTVIDPETVEPFARLMRVLDRLDLSSHVEVHLEKEGAYRVEVYTKKFRGATLGIALVEAESFFRKRLDEKRARVNKAV